MIKLEVNVFLNELNHLKIYVKEVFLWQNLNVRNVEK